MLEIGVSNINITPEIGLAMAGFAGRAGYSIGCHDPLTVRALVVGETALVTADVIGIDAALSERVRNRSSLPDNAITITATHTHSGPLSMPGRLSGDCDPNFMESLETALISAIETAFKSRKPAQLFGGVGKATDFAKNRRHSNKIVNKDIPILRFDNAKGEPIAILVSYACHPVVLGADNLLWTADYIHFFRKELESAYPTAVVVFATGGAADVNTGHSATSSLSNKPNPNRSFPTAERIGKSLSQAVCRAKMQVLGHYCGAAETFTKLNFRSTEMESKEELVQKWNMEAGRGKSKKAIFEVWIEWAQNFMDKNLDPMPVRCTALNWGGASLVALPGEIFSETALRITQSISSGYPVFLLSYADDNPGYIPPNSEYEYGGYEINEAHRFYGLGAAFAPGSAERLEIAGRLSAKNAACAANPILGELN